MKSSLINNTPWIFILLSLIFFTGTKSKAQNLRIGIHASGGVSFPFVPKKNDTDSLSSLYGIPKGRPNGLFSVGLTAEYKLNQMFRLEGQLQYRYVGWRYKIQDKAIKGSFRYSHVDMPLHLLITFPHNAYSYHRYIGFGPSLSYILHSTQLYKDKGLPLFKSDMSFDVYKIPRYIKSIDAFIGVEDSEKNSIRAGVNISRSYLVLFNGGGTTLGSVYVQLIKFF